MIQQLKGPRDLGGNLAKALHSGYKQAQEAHETEQKDIRGEQRKEEANIREENRKATLEDAKRNAVYKDLMDVVNPEFFNEPLQTQSSKLLPILLKHGKYAKDIGEFVLEQQKLHQPKKAEKGTATPEQIKATEELQNSPEWKKLTPAQVYTKALDIYGNDTAQAKRLHDVKKDEERTNLRKQEVAKGTYESEAEKLAAQTANKEYNDIVSKGETAKQGIVSLEGAKKTVGSTGFNLRNYFANAVGNPAFRDPKSEAFKTYMKDRFRIAKDIAGGKVSNFEFQTIQDMLASENKSVEANKRIIDFFEMSDRLALVRNDAAQELVDENDGVPPKNFLNKVNKATKDLEDQIVQEWRENSFPEEKGKGKKKPKEEIKEEGLPDAKEYEGRTLKNKKTGKRMISKNGKWEAV